MPGIGRGWILLAFVTGGTCLADEVALPGTRPLTATGDMSAKMLDGFEQLLQKKTSEAIQNRAQHWQRDVSSRAAYERSVEPNRARLARMIGIVDSRATVTELHYVAGTTTPSLVASNNSVVVHAVRWPVLDGVDAEGLLLVPKREVVVRIVALPDADQTPEMLAGLAPGIPPGSQFARRLAENGCLVLVPTLIDRSDTWSGNPKVWMTTQPHREWVYRPAYEIGRHIIGYEVQKVLAAVDWFERESKRRPAPIAVAGYAEGGLIALYSAAVDRRIDAALVSGYFNSRQNLWQEPIYRNLFGVLREFGDAEIASLIAPRALVIEHSEVPRIDGPPAARDGRRPWAAPGVLRTPAFASVRAEVERSSGLLLPGNVKPSLRLFAGPSDSTIGPGSDPALLALLRGIGARLDALKSSGEGLTDLRPNFDPRQRLFRQLRQVMEHTQAQIRPSDDVRKAFWKDLKPRSVASWKEACKPYREYLWDEGIGRLPKATVPINPQTRKILDKPRWSGYEVTLDVYPEVFAWGYLLVPRGLKPGERRPVVVCQHGLEGEPNDTITDDKKSQGYFFYKSFAARLADRGFVVYAPHNFYRGGNRFRQLQRLANPLKLTLYSITVAQHDRLLDWLTELPFVDPQRIGFYGLSYGGYSAMRIPALLERYALSINSAEFNDMVRKKVSVHDRYSFPFYAGYETFEWNLANTFSYGDLAGLIAPRPFMVERGHEDGVAPDEWVAGEYAKIRRLYNYLGIPDRTAIEFFIGPHTINGVGTFAFLHRHLNWPAPSDTGR